MVELDISARDLKRDVTPDEIGRIVKKHRDKPGFLIGVLEEIQEEFGFLPEEGLRLVSELTGQSMVHLFGAATFYHSFSLEPQGRHLVSVCQGTACHVRGAPAVARELSRKLKIQPGETTEDGEFSLQTARCLGACSLGPVAVVDGKYYSKLSTSRVASVLREALDAREGADASDDERTFPVVVSCPSCNHSLMDDSFSIEGRPSIRVTVAFDNLHGWLRLSSIYGRYNLYAEHEIPFGTVFDVFCPHCHARLISDWDCPTCGAPMVQMIVRGGGVVRICSRRGCCGSRSHMLDLR